MPAAQSGNTYERPRSFRLDPEARSIMEQLVKQIGVSRADIVRMAIRELGKNRGIKPKLNKSG